MERTQSSDQSSSQTATVSKEDTVDGQTQVRTQDSSIPTPPTPCSLPKKSQDTEITSTRDKKITPTVNSAMYKTALKTSFPKQIAYSTSPKSPLKNLRVLDLTRIIAGPYCTMILGDLGAEILKIERPITGDESRNWGPPFLPHSRDSVYFTSVNRNKKSLCVDLKKGREIVLDLARQSDVFIENYVPGKMAAMNLDYETLRKINPRLIYCSLTGFGYSGPYRARPGYDVIAASIGGLMHITGPKRGPPCKAGVAMTDLATGLYAHGAILAALLQRAETGEGQWVQCDLLSTQVATLINAGANFLNGSHEHEKMGSEHGSIVPYQAFETRDGFLTVGAGSDEQFGALCEKLGLTELAADEKFRGNARRVENREELVGILGEVFKGRGNREWLEVLEGATFPYGPVNSIGQVFEDPHVKAIDLVKTMEHPTAGKIKVVGPPVTYSYAENRVRSPPPILGQHTKDVLKTLLNYSDEKIEKLAKEKIIQ